MKKCDCYRTKERLVPRLSCSPYYETIGVCYGTKECEECYCGGDRTRCCFYPEVREKAIKAITVEDAIAHFKHGISHDIFSEPVTTFAKMAVEALEKQIKDEKDEEEGYWFLLDDCSNEGVYCSKCHKKVYKKDYANQKLKSKFCPNCGKKMSGEFKRL